MSLTHPPDHPVTSCLLPVPFSARSPRSRIRWVFNEKLHMPEMFVSEPASLLVCGLLAATAAGWKRDQCAGIPVSPATRFTHKRFKLLKLEKLREAAQPKHARKTGATGGGKHHQRHAAARSHLGRCGCRSAAGNHSDTSSSIRQCSCDRSDRRSGPRRRRRCTRPRLDRETHDKVSLRRRSQTQQRWPPHLESIEQSSSADVTQQ